MENLFQNQTSKVSHIFLVPSLNVTSLELQVSLDESFSYTVETVNK